MPRLQVPLHLSLGFDTWICICGGGGTQTFRPQQNLYVEYMKHSDSSTIKRTPLLGTEYAYVEILTHNWKLQPLGGNHFIVYKYTKWASLVAQRVQHLPAMWETQVRFLGREDSLKKEMANLLQYSCLENPMDRGAWWATVHGIARVRHDLVTEQQQHSWFKMLCQFQVIAQ